MVRLTPALTILALLHLPALILSQSDSSSNPPCVASCVTKNPTSSQCNGNETGTALDDCTCKTYESASALISCINKCPAAQANDFASNVPEECRATLFPNFPGIKAGGAAAGLTSTSTSTTAAATSTAASSSGTKTIATSSSSGAAATQTHSGSGGGKNVVAGGLAALGLLAAFAV